MGGWGRGVGVGGVGVGELESGNGGGVGGLESGRLELGGWSWGRRLGVGLESGALGSGGWSRGARLESWYVAPDISGAETIAISAPAGTEIAKYVLIGAEFRYFCYLAQKYSIAKNVYLTTATPRKVPRSSDNHDNAVLQCTLTSRYHNKARELMYRYLSHRSHLILRNFFPK